MALEVNMLRKSLNFKEYRASGFAAVELVVYKLINTPMNSIPELPSLGFDLDDFLFRAKDSAEIPKLETEFINKVNQVTNNAALSVTIKRAGDTVNIEIAYTQNGKEDTLPISITESTNGRILRFRDIVVI